MTKQYETGSLRAVVREMVRFFRCRPVEVLKLLSDDEMRALTWEALS